MALSPTDILFPTRALARAITNLDRRIRKVEVREVPQSQYTWPNPYPDDVTFQGSMDVAGPVVIRDRSTMMSGPGGAAGWFYSNAAGVSKAFAGLEDGNDNLWRVYSSVVGGNKLSVQLDTGHILGSNDIIAGGNLQSQAGLVRSGSASGQYTDLWFNQIAHYGGGDFHIYNSSGSIIINPSTAYFHPVNNTVNLGYPGAGLAWANIYTNGEIRGYGSVFNIASTANIQLSPGGTVVHPSGDNNCLLGYPSLRWAAIFGYTLDIHAINSPGQLSFNVGAHFVATTLNGGWIYLRSTGHTFFDGSVGAIVAPEIDNKLVCGGTGNRWQYVAAVNGTINTCYEHEKDIVGMLDPDHALDALVHTPISLYHPKDSSGVIDKSMLYAGIVNTSTDPRLQIGKGALTSSGHQAAYTIAAVQSLSQQLTELRNEVAALKEALAS